MIVSNVEISQLQDEAAVLARHDGDGVALCSPYPKSSAASHLSPIGLIRISDGEAAGRARQAPGRPAVPVPACAVVSVISPHALADMQRAADLIADAAEMPIDKKWRFIFATYATADPYLRMAIVAAVVEAETTAALLGADR